MLGTPPRNNATNLCVVRMRVFNSAGMRVAPALLKPGPRAAWNPTCREPKAVRSLHFLGRWELLPFVVAGAQEIFEKSVDGHLKAQMGADRVTQVSVLFEDNRRERTAGRASGFRRQAMRVLQLSSSPRGGAFEPQPLGCGPRTGSAPQNTPNKRISFFRYPANYNPAPDSRARRTRTEKDHRHSLTTDN